MPDSGVFLNVTATSQVGSPGPRPPTSAPPSGPTSSRLARAGATTLSSARRTSPRPAAIIFNPPCPSARRGSRRSPDVTPGSGPHAHRDPDRACALAPPLPHSSPSARRETERSREKREPPPRRRPEHRERLFHASPNATSTQVVIHSLDGLDEEQRPRHHVKNRANFSASYSFSVPPNTRFRPNMTLLQNPPVLTATRPVDSRLPVRTA